MRIVLRFTGSSQTTACSKPIQNANNPSKWLVIFSKFRNRLAVIFWGHRNATTIEIGIFLRRIRCDIWIFTNIKSTTQTKHTKRIESNVSGISMILICRFVQVRSHDWMNSADVVHIYYIGDLFFQIITRRWSHVISDLAGRHQVIVYLQIN